VSEASGTVKLVRAAAEVVGSINGQQRYQCTETLSAITLAGVPLIVTLIVAQHRMTASGS
jgi:hypothetical protein